MVRGNALDAPSVSVHLQECDKWQSNSKTTSNRASNRANGTISPLASKAIRSAVHSRIVIKINKDRNEAKVSRVKTSKARVSRRKTKSQHRHVGGLCNGIADFCLERSMLLVVERTRGAGADDRT